MEDSPFERLKEIMKRLRSPDGCPWDREQNLESLRTYLVEETYEVIDAIDEKDGDRHREELGDLLLQIVFQAQIAAEEGRFTIDDVARSISEKLVRRHPHVFGEESVSSSREVLHNWEQLKREEREEKGGGSVLEGIPKALPALTKAQRIGEKVSRVGFDWKNRKGVMEKVYEELDELKKAVDTEATQEIEREMGDLLFSLVNLSRHLGIDLENALQGANRKFISRFQYIEEKLRGRKMDLKDASLDDMDGLWEESKSARRPGDDGKGASKN